MALPSFLPGDVMMHSTDLATVEWQNDFIDSLLRELNDDYIISSGAATASCEGGGQLEQGVHAAANDDVDDHTAATADHCMIPSFWRLYDDYMISNDSNIAAEEQAVIANSIASHEMIPRPHSGDEPGSAQSSAFANCRPCWQQYATDSHIDIGAGDQEASMEDICKADYVGVEDRASPQEKHSGKRKPPTKASRRPRFAIVIESASDHVPDGYKWRKYGRRIAKDSQYPRTYYRCTNKACQVKKKTERSFNNPRMLIVTYEGQHNHNRLASLFGVDFAYFATTPLS